MCRNTSELNIWQERNDNDVDAFRRQILCPGSCAGFVGDFRIDYSNHDLVVITTVVQQFSTGNVQTSHEVMYCRVSRCDSVQPRFDLRDVCSVADTQHEIAFIVVSGETNVGACWHDSKHRIEFFQDPPKASLGRIPGTRSIVGGIDQKHEVHNTAMTIMWRLSFRFNYMRSRFSCHWLRRCDMLERSGIGSRQSWRCGLEGSDGRLRGRNNRRAEHWLQIVG
jgi:hypothetical protein